MEHLRTVKLESSEGDYTLATWDTYRRARFGQSTLRYEFTDPKGSVVFEGEDFSISPYVSVDSDEALKALLGFLTLKPGDTDDSYFEKYSAEQMDFAESMAEELSLYCLEEAEFEDVEEE